MKKPTYITCKRWFQKSFGNTYFSAYVSFDDGSTEQLIKFQYGYGDHCLSEALKEMAKRGYVELPVPRENGSQNYNTTIFLREVLNVDYDIIDVDRKKDM